MKKYEFLPLTADLAFMATGSTTETAFEAAAEALFASITDIESISPIHEYSIEKENKELDLLAVDFLGELLYIHEVEEEVLGKFKVEITERDGKYHLSAKAWGDSTQHYEVHGHVKAVTYHDLKLEKMGLMYKLKVVCDT